MAKVKVAVPPGAIDVAAVGTRTPGRVLPPTNASACPGGDATAMCRPSVGHAVEPVFFIVTVSEPVEGAPGGRTSRGAADWLATDPSRLVVICHHDDRKPSE